MKNIKINLGNDFRNFNKDRDMRDIKKLINKTGTISPFVE
jgi:hypothetical protein